MPKPYRTIKWPNGKRYVIGANPDKSVETNAARTYRAYFLVKITGSDAVVPFYISSGSAGKVDAEGNLYGVGQAFPFFGMAEGTAGGWHNKTAFTWEGEDPRYAIDTYYGMPLLRRIAEEINIAWSKHAHNYRNPPLEKTTRQDKIEKKVNGELKRTIGITPLRNTKTALYGTERDRDFLHANIDVARKRIEGDVMKPLKKGGRGGSREPKKLDSTFARAVRQYESNEARSKGYSPLQGPPPINYKMHKWSSVLSTEENHRAAQEAGAPRGPCRCGSYHDKRLACPNYERYHIEKEHYQPRPTNNQRRVSN